MNLKLLRDVIFFRALFQQLTYPYVGRFDLNKLEPSGDEDKELGPIGFDATPFFEV